MLSEALRVAFWRRPFEGAYQYDPKAIGDAVLLVAGVSAVVGFFTQFWFEGVEGADIIFDVIRATIYGLAQWLLLAAAIWVVGTYMLNGQGDFRAVIQNHGFAVLPQLLGAFSFRVGLVVADVQLFSLIALVWFYVILSLTTALTLGQETREGFINTLIGFAVLGLAGPLLGRPFPLFGLLE